MKKRNYYRYQLKDGNEIKYIGITNDPDRRESEHNSDKKFNKMDVVGPAVSKETAQQWEEDRLQTYRNGHEGQNPKYNQTDNG